MHLLTTTSTTLDEIVEAVDLRQPPGDIAVLSFAESDLAGLAAAWATEKDALPSVRLTQLSHLRHPLSIDLWIDRVGRHAKVILVRLLGGLDFWRYGVDRLTAVTREHGIALALLPGEDRDDPRLAELSTLPAAELDCLLAFFREGGTENLRALLRRLARHAGAELEVHQPRPVPRTAGYLPGIGPVEIDRLVESLIPGQPVVPIVFYRALLLAADLAPIDALCAALVARGLAPAPLVVPSLKDDAAAEFLRRALPRLDPAVIVTTTAFAAGNAAEPTPLDGPGAPVLQVVIANTKRSAWRDSPRGLGAADLAMHVVLPELDGRVLAGVIAFKDPLPPHDGLAFTALTNKPEPDRVAAVAERIAPLVRLQRTKRADRRIAVLMPDYPGASGRTGYAVGLDVPESVVALLADLKAAGYTIEDAPQTPRALLGALESLPSHPSVEKEHSHLPLADYARLAATLPSDVLARVQASWGDPAADLDVRDGAFRFRARAFGNVTVALAPDRGRASERRADYHDPALPPRHALIAFGLWLRHRAKIHALVHMGAHGTLEWLPGKAVALSETCYPEIIVGPLPVIYPFIVSNPGEAAQAKRRIAAVTIGHAPPPLVSGSLSGDARELERLVDEYAQADGLDRRRRERLARLIVEHAERSGLAREAGVANDLDPDQALRRIDAWLCDLKDVRSKDGQHVYGRAAPNADPLWQASASAERAALLAALEGRHVAPGPAGSPERGRRDVLPTGRNLFTADPRALPTRTAFDLGRLAADEVIRGYLQTHGEMPRALVIDLWGSATLRTGGEEIAHGLALMGCRPVWDHATGRVTGIEVEAVAAIGRPRVDVTWRVSGLFRDMFPTQIALIDAAVRAVAARDEADEDNPLAGTARTAPDAAPARIFGTAPGAYGAGIEHLLGREHDRAALAAAYLDAASHSYGGSGADGTALPGAFAARVAAADLLVHPGDDPARDLLEGVADVGFVGGFAAAAAMLGRAPDLVMLDVTDPQRPRARPLSAALARIVRGRAVDERFIAGQMRHGPRGAAELAETVDRLIDFAETTGAVPSTLIDLVHEAYMADPRVRAFLLRENPGAASAIAERLASARRQGLWHPRRNDVDATLVSMLTEARA
ncbi:MAG TPA: cobaltochelatase subunit CobN [Xanthobacteraceae bacterium]|jgi:cobaltochelatase CobN|nr:cobaltochelatase subunit CobN [Xanthobacteraceae bacterium]